VHHNPKPSIETLRPKSQDTKRTAQTPTKALQDSKPPVLRSRSATINSEPVKRVEAVLQNKQLNSQLEQGEEKRSALLTSSPNLSLEEEDLSDLRQRRTSINIISQSKPTPRASTSFESRLSEHKQVAGKYDMPIRVVVRKRPLSRGEHSRQDKDVLEIRPNGVVMVHEPKVKVDLTKVIETQTFVFDDAFDYNETNECIYFRTVHPLVSFMFEGGKASCFAYGQTGSGKVITSHSNCLKWI
jgi:hypothetical protein